MNRQANSNQEYVKLRVEDITSFSSKKFYHLRLTSPGWNWKPGQFVMLRPNKWTFDPFGARPFSIADDDGKNLHIYFQVVGKGTQKLAELRKNESVMVWGPLGNHFESDPNVPTLLLAGGMGIVPFVGLVENYPNPKNLELIFGHRHDIGNYPYNLMARKILTWNVQDVSEKDLTWLERALRIKMQGYSEDGMIMACGPRPFLQLIQQFALQFNVRAQVSLETRMLCGIGACLGCVVQNQQQENIPVCSHGPVFNIQDVVL